MNSYTAQQIKNMMQTIETFDHACTLACKMDDGIISKEEKKLLGKITKANNRYKKALMKLL